MHWAARQPSTASTIKLLLEKGAKVNVKNSDQQTPLHLAAWEDNLPEAMELIKGGADLVPFDGAQRTPLHLAAYQNNKEVTKLLIDK